MPDVFLALSLLMVPKLSLAHLFVLAVELVNEAQVAAKRVDAFLKIPEPESTSIMDGNKDGQVKVEQGNFSWYVQKTQTKRSTSRTVMRVLSRVKRASLFESFVG